MSELGKDTDIKKILKNFPFNRQNLQKRKLSKYFVFCPGMNKAELQEKTGISQPTIRRIQKSYRDLSDKQKTKLLDDMIDHFRKNILGSK